MESPYGFGIEWWDFDSLSAVAEFRDAVHLVSAALSFGNRAVAFEALDDDTIWVHEADAGSAGRPKCERHDAEREEPWRRFIGASVRWRRVLTNHHGWLDGYQLEFSGNGGGVVGDGIEIIVAASELMLGTTTFLAG